MTGEINWLVAVGKGEVCGGAEANISSGGGEASRRIASYSEIEYVNEAHQMILEEVRKGEKERDTIAAFINGVGRSW